MFTTTLARTLAVAIAAAVASVPAHAQDFYHPFGPNSIWNTPIPSNASYVPANLGVLGGLEIDPESIYTTYSNNRLINVLQLNQPSNIVAQLYLPDNLNIPPNGTNGCASFVEPDGQTTIEFNAFQRDVGNTYFSSDIYAAQGFLQGGSNLFADDYSTALGGHSGSGLSTIGGSIRQGSTENNDLNHALKIELDFGQLYFTSNNPANENGTYRWPAVRSDGDFPGQSGNPPPYYGTNPSLTMGSLLAIPPNVNITQLGLSPTGVLIAQALQNYGAYVVDTVGSGSNTFHTNGGYTCNLCVEEGENPNYFVNAINQDNSGSSSPVYHDFSIIYPLLQVVDSNNGNGYPGFFRLINKAHGTALQCTGDQYNSVSGAQWVASTPAGWDDDEQTWTIVQQPDGYYRLINKAHLTALQCTGDEYNGVSGAQWVASTPEPWDDDEQEWSIQNYGGGYVRLINHNHGTALQCTGDQYNSVSGAQWVASTPAPWNDDEQAWQIVPK